MRAVVVNEYGNRDAIVLEEVEAPEPGPGQIRVNVRATTVNYVDLLVIDGKYQFLPPAPFTPGKLPVGVVEKVGVNVSKLQEGDRVLTLAEEGGYADKVVVAESEAYVIPESMSYEEAAAMALGFDTAWFALRERARLRPEETVFVLGATGSVGMASIQLAKSFGCKVLAGVSSMRSAEVVLDAGADAVIDLSMPDLNDGMREQVRALTDGHGVDVIVDSLGDKYFKPALRCLAWCGRLVVVGFAAGEIPTVKANYLLLKNIEVSGLQVSDYRKRLPGRMKDCFKEIFELYDAGRVRPPSFSVRTLPDFKEAFADIESRRTRDRVLLVP